MYYFIPSWYTGINHWQFMMPRWFQSNDSFEFDDTVNQLRMFMKANEMPGLIVLSYATGLRHFLHRQGLLEIPYWNLFDAIQGVKVTECGTLSYTDLEWPEHLEWFYMPGSVIGYKDQKKCVRVEFGQDGEMVWIDRYENNQIHQRDIYDDRGFLSGTLFYEDNKPVRQQYFDYNGFLQFEHDLKSGQVTIADQCHYPFLRKKYRSMEDIVQEALRRYFSDIDFQDIIVIAADHGHDNLIMRSLFGQKVVLSFFGDRYDFSRTEELKRDLTRALFVVADTEHNAKLIRENGTEEVNIYDISPFDTRFSLGTSQRIRELKILMPLDGLNDELLEIAMEQVFDYMDRNEKVVLYAVTESKVENHREELYEKLSNLMMDMGYDSLGIYLEGARDQYMGNEKNARIMVMSYGTEIELMHLIFDVRLILDVRDQPNQYLQIAGISAGIPQVNYRFTRYVIHEKNGYIIRNIHHITGALEYYLSTLSNWNEALIYCLQEIGNYNSGVLSAKWNELVMQYGAED